jgi:hypothetical protein
VSFINKNAVKSDNRDFLIEIIDKYLFYSNEKSSTTFFNYFKNEICTSICKRYNFVIAYLFSKLNPAFERIVNLLVILIEFLGSDKQLRKSSGTKIVEKIYENWSSFREYWRPDSSLEHKLCLVNLLTKSILIESLPVISNKNSENQSIRNVAEMFMSLLIDSKTVLKFKCKLLDLLHFFTDSPEPFVLKPHINQFQAQLPLKSQELTKGEDNYNDYVSIIGKLLVSLELTLSQDILNVIVGIISRESEHICDEEVQSCFRRFIKRLDNLKQASLIELYWSNWFKNSSQSDNAVNDERKFNIFRKVIIIFLEHCEKPVFLDFMCENVMFLVKILEEDIKPDASTFEFNCFYKKSIFEILQLAFKRLYKDEIFFPSAKLCIEFEKSKFGKLIYLAPFY